MNNEQVIEQNQIQNQKQNLDIDQDFDLEVFEQELIAEYGSLEAAYLDLSDRPDKPARPSGD